MEATRPLDLAQPRTYPPAMTVQPSDSILIVDFGSQVTQLIARRVREAGVYSEIAPFTAAAEAFARMAPRGVILSGSPASVLDAEGPRIPDEILASGLPMLGICYGQQALMHQLGGEVLLGDAGEFGRAFIDIGDRCALSDPVRARVDINPEALCCYVHVELGNAPKPERSGTSERVREDKLVRSRGRDPALEGGGDLGPSDCGHDPYYCRHHNSLDHGESAPRRLGPGDVTPYGKEANCCGRVKDCLHFANRHSDASRTSP